MSRQDIALGEPHPPEALADAFPRADSLSLGEWFRAHTDYPLEADHGCWWFASARPDGGRFDLPAPHGTCYFADDVEAAVRERLGPVWGSAPFLPPVATDGVHLSSVDLSPYTEPSDIANTKASEATGFVTREISAGAPYDLTRRHAAAFAMAGFRGVAYSPRFSTGAESAIALFGPTGRPDPGRPAFEVVDWRTRLRSKTRSTVTRARAAIVAP